MRNILQIKVNNKDITDTISEYESKGLTLLTTKPLRSLETILVFEGPRDIVAENSKGQSAFMEFDDGTISPLYITRNRNFWED